MFCEIKDTYFLRFYKGEATKTRSINCPYKAGRDSPQSSQDSRQKFIHFLTQPHASRKEECSAQPLTMRGSMGNWEFCKGPVMSNESKDTLTFMGPY